MIEGSRHCRHCGCKEESIGEVKGKHGMMIVLNKSPAPTLCINSPETLNLLSLQVQSGAIKKEKR